jgi:hypothetical protein
MRHKLIRSFRVPIRAQISVGQGATAASLSSSLASPVAQVIKRRLLFSHMLKDLAKAPFIPGIVLSDVTQSCVKQFTLTSKLDG